MVDYFLVLGAGASQGARDHLDNRAKPPLGCELAGHLYRIARRRGFFSSPGLRRFLRSALKSGDFEKAYTQHLARTASIDKVLFAPDLPTETALDTFRRLGIRKKEDLDVHPELSTNSINDLIRKCLFRLPYMPDRYDDLFGSLTGRSVAVITPNYDLLVEQALERIGLQWCYPGVRSRMARLNGVPLFKLHGSINFFSNIRMPFKKRIHTRIEPAVGLARDTGSDYVLGCRGKRTPRLVGRLGPPIIAAYMQGKPVNENYICIERIYSECLQAIRQSKHAKVAVIGLHIPSPTDDSRINSVLLEVAKAAGKAIFVNCDDTECRKASSMGFQVWPVKFHEFLKARIPEAW